MQHNDKNHDRFLRRLVTIIQNSVTLKFSKNSLNNMHDKESIREKFFRFNENQRFCAGFCR